MNTPDLKDLPGELDRHITGLPADLPEADQQLIGDLIRVAKSNPPDPRYVDDLSRRLRQDHPGGAPGRAIIRPFWLALTGAAAVILIVLFGLPA